MPGLREALDAAISGAEAATTPNETVVNTPVEKPVEAIVTPQEQVTPVEKQPVEEEPKELEIEAKKVEPSDKKPEEQPKEQAIEQKTEHRTDKPPQSWKKDAKEAWSGLPLPIRQEVYRREQQISQALIEASKNREAVETLNKVVAPYQARLNAAGGAFKAIETLLQTEYALATSSKAVTAQMMAKLIKDYDVDIALLDQVLSGEAQQQTQQPDISQLVQQQVQQALAPIYQQQNLHQQQLQDQANATVEEMSLDPQYPFFDEVREEMADIVEMKAKKGFTITLPEAYNIAVQLNPQLASQVNKQAVISSATKTHQQAQRAVNASSSVSGSPSAGGSLVNVGDGTLRGAIEAAMNGARL